MGNEVPRELLAGKENRFIPGLPSYSKRAFPGAQRPWVRPGEPCAQPARSPGWPYVPWLIHALWTQPQPSIAASLFPDSIRWQVPILISSRHPLCVHVGQRLAAAPLPQAAKNVNLHTPPLCRPPPSPALFHPLP